MKCNTRELALLSDQPCIIEGRLNYKKVYNGSYRNPAENRKYELEYDVDVTQADSPPSNKRRKVEAFKERWFRLIKNYLFYFKISEMGKFDTKNPAGVFVMENSSIQMEHGQSISFSFSISFIDEPEKSHIFAARCEDNVVQWVMKLRQCTYEYLRNQLHTLQSKIYSITGKDPLLMVPRNDGACLWAPSVPFSTTPACTVNTSSFVCHLHTNGAFTLERSKSDTQAYQHLRGQQKSNTSFYVEKNTSDEAKEVKNYSLEKSQTSALFNTSLNTVSMSIFDNRPQFSRAAPSPPVRNKLSPRFRRGEVSEDHKVFTDQGKFLGRESILGVVPIPPRRKVSPKQCNIGKESNGPESTKDEEVETETEDLIKF